MSVFHILWPSAFREFSFLFLTSQILVPDPVFSGLALTKIKDLLKMNEWLRSTCSSVNCTQNFFFYGPHSQDTLLFCSTPTLTTGTQFTICCLVRFHVRKRSLQPVIHNIFDSFSAVGWNEGSFHVFTAIKQHLLNVGEWSFLQNKQLSTHTEIFNHVTLLHDFLDLETTAFSKKLDWWPNTVEQACVTISIKYAKFFSLMQMQWKQISISYKNLSNSIE